MSDTPAGTDEKPIVSEGELTEISGAETPSQVDPTLDGDAAELVTEVDAPEAATFQAEAPDADPAEPEPAAAEPEPATDVTPDGDTPDGDTPLAEPEVVAAESEPAPGVKPNIDAPDTPAAEPDADPAEPELAADVTPDTDTPAAEPEVVAAEPELATDVTPDIDAPDTPEAAAPAAVAAEPESAADTTPEAAAGAAPKPAPKPSMMPRPAPRRGSPTAPVAPIAAPLGFDAAAVAEAEAFGRVDADGTVYVREAAGERVVGQFPDVTASEAMRLYVRRYLDLSAKVGLFETRLTSTDLSVREIDQTLSRLRDETKEPAAVGDLDALRARVDALRTIAAKRRAELDAARAAARTEALAARTAIADAAEKIVGARPGSIQWRTASDELGKLLDQWKEAQRSGPRLDRSTEDALWKRFSAARATFERERRHYFTELERSNTTAKTQKTALVTEAEKLATSTDWAAGAGAFRDLMTRWKSSGRAARKDDDALWARFRAAQDAFFGARDAQNAAIDAEYGKNLEVKRAILAEAEKLVPVTDLSAAKAALRGIQERWETAGKVPREEISRIEGRLRAVEQAVRDAEQTQWRRSNPETRARAEGAAAQLESAIAALETDLTAAKAKGDKRKIADVEVALAARRSWLEQVVRAAQDSRG